MDLFREKHTPQIECGPSQKVRLAWSSIIGWHLVLTLISIFPGFTG